MAVVVLLLAIILPLTLKKSGDDPEPTPVPPPPPPPPPLPDAYNPYSVDNSTLVTQTDKVMGRLSFSQEKLDALNAMPIAETDSDVIKADPRHIPTGPNNMLIKEVSFEFGQANYKVAYAKFGDAENTRYNPDTNFVKNVTASPTMRLDMCGFNLVSEPFGFEFVDTRKPDNVLVSTKNATFIMMDKYMQLDMHLPTHNIYGLGERTREFALSEGTWTMWANGRETPYDDG